MSQFIEIEIQVQIDEIKLKQRVHDKVKVTSIIKLLSVKFAMGGRLL